MDTSTPSALEQTAAQQVIITQIEYDARAVEHSGGNAHIRRLAKRIAASAHSPLDAPVHVIGCVLEAIPDGATRAAVAALTPEQVKEALIDYVHRR